MLHRSICALLLAFSLGLAACGGGGLQPTEDLKPAGPPPDLFTKMCPSSCNSHAECGNGCAPAPVGANCCDTITHTCYVVATAMCPAPPAPDMAMVSPY